MKRTYWRWSFEFCFLYLATYPGNHLAVHSDCTYFLYSCTVLHCVAVPRFMFGEMNIQLCYLFPNYPSRRFVPLCIPSTVRDCLFLHSVANKICCHTFRFFSNLIGEKWCCFNLHFFYYEWVEVSLNVFKGHMFKGPLYIFFVTWLFISFTLFPLDFGSLSLSF